MEGRSNLSIHRLLAHSYIVYFVLFLSGIILDIVFRFEIFTDVAVIPIGISIIVFATLLIFWAQASTRNLKKEKITKETFCQGPYCYTRNPTHWGLCLLMLGFGIVASAPFVIAAILIYMVISKFSFLDREEKMLAAKYGEPYLEYKKSVKL